MRLLYATIVAIFAGALPMAFSLNVILVVYDLMVSTFLVLVVGWPLYGIISRWYQITTLRAAIAGFLIGWLSPLLFLGIFAPGFPLAENFTLEGVLWFAIILGGPGLLAGGLFGFIMSREKMPSWLNPLFLGLVGVYLAFAVVGTVVFGPNVSAEQPRD